MTPQEILSHVRELIRQHAGDDADKWWYANRFVFARLQLDERKTKASIKQKLIAEKRLCRYCGNQFETRQNIHLHRLESSKGYSDTNCVLMHADCHTKHHSSASRRQDEKVVTATDPVITKWSKLYQDKSFAYWWDIAPPLSKSLDNLEAVEFAKKDTGERCSVPIEVLKKFLTPDRQTTRSRGNWGIKVLVDRPDELAFEPRGQRDQWLFLQVTWLNAEVED